MSNVVRIVREVDKAPIRDVLKKCGISRSTFDAWKRKFGGMGVGEAKNVHPIAYLPPSPSRTSVLRKYLHPLHLLRTREDKLGKHFRVGVLKMKNGFLTNMLAVRGGMSLRKTEHPTQAGCRTSEKRPEMRNNIFQSLSSKLKSPRFGGRLRAFGERRESLVVDRREVVEGGVPTTRVVEAFDVVEDGHARFGLRAEAASVDELAFEAREEALAHSVVVRVADRSA